MHSKPRVIGFEPRRRQFRLRWDMGKFENDRRNYWKAYIESFEGRWAEERLKLVEAEIECLERCWFVTWIKPILDNGEDIEEDA
jgi:hypothetical protein